MELEKGEAKCFQVEGSESKETGGGNQSEMLVSHMNPLDIPEILLLVTGYCVKIEDFKNFRLVCTKWRNETFKRWRNTVVLLINKETKRVLLRAFDESGYEGLTEAGKEKLQAKRDTFLLRKVPFKSYRLEGGYRTRYDGALEAIILPKVIVPNADYFDIGQCVISGSRFTGDDQLQEVFRYNLKVTELALTPLRRTGPVRYNWNHYALRNQKAMNLRKLTLSSPPLPQKRSKNVALFQIDPQFNGDVENAYWIVIKRMPNLKVLHEISGNGTYHILIAMIQAAIRNEVVIKLEDITVLDTQIPFNLPYAIAEYFRVARPPLSILKVPITWVDCVHQDSDFIKSLRLVQDTLRKLEMEVDCRRGWSRQLAMSIQGDANFQLNGLHFPSLTHFKVVKIFEVGFQVKFFTFDLNHLRKMPKLQEFFFGFKTPGVFPDEFARTKKSISEEAPTWINEANRFAPENASLPKGIQLDPVLNDEVEGDGLKDLKSFRFHQNLTKASLELLAKWTKNLQTLETILDTENVSVVVGKWEKLEKVGTVFYVPE